MQECAYTLDELLCAELQKLILNAKFCFVCGHKFYHHSHDHITHSQVGPHSTRAESV